MVDNGGAGLRPDRLAYGRATERTTLEEFLDDCVEACAHGAENRMCYRALFSQLYFAYRGRAMLRGERATAPAEFLLALRKRYPAAEPARIRPEGAGAIDLPDGYRGLEIDGVRFLGAPWKPKEPRTKRYAE